jgi:hypothetical protein
MTCANALTFVALTTTGARVRARDLCDWTNDGETNKSIGLFLREVVDLAQETLECEYLMLLNLDKCR